jgi:uncharacterized protein YdaU (DUF1376 family)
MGRTVSAKTYRSPGYKLLAFFQRSRDGWKAKAEQRNLRIKRLKNRVAALEESRGKWKEKARACESRIAALREAIEEQKSSPAGGASSRSRGGGSGGEAGGRAPVWGQVDGVVC